MRTRLFLCVAMATLALPNEQAQSAEGPAKEIPELAQLSQFAGAWDIEVTVEPGDGSKGSTSKGTSTGEWILGGRFLQQSWTVEETEGFPGLKGTTLRTYDPERKLYRSWTFHSSGYTQADRGTWDEKARTFTWTGRDRTRDLTTTTKSSFPEEGQEQWSIVTKDSEGKVVVEVTGKSTRRED